MKFYIEKVILWPKDQSKTFRSIDFSIGTINVLTGQSQTGKSSIIAIIDYCLGSKKCTIPVGIVRDTTGWFGLQIKLSDKYLLLARREPGMADATNEMFMFEGTEVKIPESIERNCNQDYVKQRLNQISGLTDLGFDDEDVSSIVKSSAPSFRDLSAFEFQPQHIIANPYTLFFKADTYEHQEKLKVIFPLVLGAIDNTSMRVKKEIKELEKELSRAKGELDNRRKIFDNWAGELRSYYVQGMELGLIQSIDSPNPSWTTDVLVSRLATVVAKSKEDAQLVIREGSTEGATIEMNRLSSEERELSHQLGHLRNRLNKLLHLAGSEIEYEDSLLAQKGRLQSVRWLSDKIRAETVCPLCGSTQSTASQEITSLLNVLENLEQATGSVAEAKLVVDRETLRTKEQIRETERSLNTVRDHRTSLEVRDERLRLARQRSEEIFRFLGRIEQSIENYRLVQADGKLSRIVSELQERLDSLRKKINPAGEQAKIASAIQRISELTTNYVRIIGVEIPEKQVQIDLQNLTLHILAKSGRFDYLWEIGSGANWMGYHISVLLALQEFFLEQLSSPVPTFFFVDQPSQVYFPESWPGDDPPEDDKSSVPVIPSDDIDRVNKIFRTFQEFARRTKSMVQVVVIDHADEVTWKGVEGVKLVERWRGSSDFLIPKSWIEGYVAPA